tara:strand:+ start:707 stop:973 length:267 start_codon:yes stop_codon:yes gene_type:complete
MTYFFLVGSSFFNFCFYIFAIGFVVALILEQFVKQTENEMNLMIVQINRRFCWRQAWVVNLLWFMTNIGLYFVSRNTAPVTDNFWQGM